MHILTLHGIVLQLNLGIEPFEQLITSEVQVNVSYSTKTPSEQDDINTTINYVDIAEQLTAIAQAQRYQLIETFTTMAADNIFATYPLQWLSITVIKKNAIWHQVDVSVTMTRGTKPNL